MGLLQTTNKGYWRNFVSCSVFFVPFGTAQQRFWRGNVFGFEIIKFSDLQQLSFSEGDGLRNSFCVVQTHACAPKTFA